MRKLLPRHISTLPVLPRSHMLPFSEGGTKAALTVKAGTKGNFLDGNVRQLQQEFCRSDPGGNQILVGSEACFCRKDPGKMKGTQTGIGSNHFQGQRLTETFIDISQCISNYCGMGGLAASISSGI